jgi:hypothetical protein
MIEEFEVSVERGIPIVVVAGARLILDTGSPVSFARTGNITLGGCGYQVPVDCQAGSPDSLIAQRITAVINDQGQRVALTRNGELLVMGPKDRIMENFSIPNGAILMVEEGQNIQPGQSLCKWDPHMIPILAEVGGKIRFDEIEEGETLRKERDPSGLERWVIMEHKGDLHPQIVIEDERGQSLEVHYIPEKAHLEVLPVEAPLPAIVTAQEPAIVIEPDLAADFEVLRARLIAIAGSEARQQALPIDGLLPGAEHHLGRRQT